MFGLFRPSPILAGGLLWKTPWRISAPRKLRQRRRLRRVDNVITVLDSALRRAFGPASLTDDTSNPSSSSYSDPSRPTQAQPQTETQAQLQAKRLGRGPKRGDLLPASGSVGGPLPGMTAGQVLRTTAQAAKENGTIKDLERWKADMPREEEMLARDKYTVFDRKVRGYRKGVHKVPKWTRVTQRLNPPGY